MLSRLLLLLLLCLLWTLKVVVLSLVLVLVLVEVVLVYSSFADMTAAVAVVLLLRHSSNRSVVADRSTKMDNNDN